MSSVHHIGGGGVGDPRGRGSKQVEPEPTASQMREAAEMTRRSAAIRDGWQHPKPHKSPPPPRSSKKIWIGVVAVLVAAAVLVIRMFR